jgi:enamine deaminase RidA (YjgF/YER057c/UK114 family)
MVVGYDTDTTSVPESAAAQVANLFRHAEAILRAGNATWNDVVRMTFYAPSLDSRADINVAWTTVFPDPERRPARITHQTDSGLGIRCEFIAYVPEQEGASRC